MKIVFVVNNKNDRLANVLPGIQKSLERVKIEEAEFLYTMGEKHAIELARNAAESGCDYLIGVGGDGTLNELVNGMQQSKVAAQEYPVLGLLPYGSANDFAKTASISTSIDELIGMILSRNIQKIDLGKIVLHQTREIRYFINIAGIGLGPEVVQGLARSSSVLGPGFNYFRHIVKGFLRYVKKDVSCSSKDWQWKGRLLQMAVANGRYFGHGICIAPEAKLTDGQFQIAVFGDLSIWNYLKNLGKLKKGVKIKHPEVYYYHAEEVVLESAVSCGIEADGEYVGLAPATISVLPKAISFLMPPR